MGIYRTTFFGIAIMTSLFSGRLLLAGIYEEISDARNECNKVWQMCFEVTCPKTSSKRLHELTSFLPHVKNNLRNFRDSLTQLSRKIEIRKKLASQSNEENLLNEIATSNLDRKNLENTMRLLDQSELKIEDTYELAKIILYIHSTSVEIKNFVMLRNASKVIQLGDLYADRFIPRASPAPVFHLRELLQLLHLGVIASIQLEIIHRDPSTAIGIDITVYKGQKLSEIESIYNLMTGDGHFTSLEEATTIENILSTIQSSNSYYKVHVILTQDLPEVYQ